MPKSASCFGSIKHVATGIQIQEQSEAIRPMLKGGFQEIEEVLYASAYDNIVNRGSDCIEITNIAS